MCLRTTDYGLIYRATDQYLYHATVYLQHNCSRDSDIIGPYPRQVAGTLTSLVSRSGITIGSQIGDVKRFRSP